MQRNPLPIFSPYPLLPTDLALYLVDFLPASELIAASMFNKRWHLDNHFWVNRYRKFFGPITLHTSANEKAASEADAKLQFIAAYLYQQMRTAKLPHQAQLYYLKLREFSQLHAKEPWSKTFLGAAIVHHAEQSKIPDGAALLIERLEQGDYRAGVMLAEIVTGKDSVIRHPVQKKLLQKPALFVTIKNILSDLYNNHAMKSTASLLADLLHHKEDAWFLLDCDAREQHNWVLRAIDAGSEKAVTYLIDDHASAAPLPDNNDDEENIVQEDIHQLHQRNLTFLNNLLLNTNLCKQVKAYIHYRIGASHEILEQSKLAEAAFTEARTLGHERSLREFAIAEQKRSVQATDPAIQTQHKQNAISIFTNALQSNDSLAAEQLARIHSQNGIIPAAVIEQLKSAYINGNNNSATVVANNCMKPTLWYNLVKNVIWVHLAAHNPTESKRCVAQLEPFSEVSPWACIALGIIHTFGIKNYLQPDLEKAGEYFRQADNLLPDSLTRYLEVWKEQGIPCKDIEKQLTVEQLKIAAAHAQKCAASILHR